MRPEHEWTSAEIAQHARNNGAVPVIDAHMQRAPIRPRHNIDRHFLAGIATGALPGIVIGALIALAAWWLA